MRHAKTERNVEIYHRRMAGVMPKELAAEYGLTVGRVCQIVTETGKRLGLPYPKHEVERPPEPTPSVRPRIRKAASGLWECSDGVIARAARSFQGAYQKWLTAAIADAQRQVAPTAPVISAPKPEPLPDYSGPITVLPGTAQRRALSLSTTMQLNGARAAQAQPRMISIAGGSAREA